MNRSALLPALTAAVTLLLVACAAEEGTGLDTLPPIRTTTTTTTTIVELCPVTKYYTVKAGDNLAAIATAFAVPASEIVRRNNLADGGQILQIGQELLIPADIEVVAELPTPPPTTAAP